MFSYNGSSLKTPHCFQDMTPQSLLVQDVLASAQADLAKKLHIRCFCWTSLKDEACSTTYPVRRI